MLLPLAAFDGQAFEEPIRQLRKEWYQLLRKPCQKKQPRTGSLIKRMQQNTMYDEQRIAILESNIVWLEVYPNQLMSNTLKDFVKTTREQSNQSIDKYRNLLLKAHNRKERNSQRLRVLCFVTRD